jgi:hypothetical protein
MGFAAIIGFTFFIVYFVFANVRQALQSSFGRMEATSSRQINLDSVYLLTNTIPKDMSLPLAPPGTPMFPVDRDEYPEAK